MLHDVVAVEPMDGFRVWVRFEDGLEGVADLSDLAGHGVFSRWAEDPAEFFEVAVDREAGTLVWPGGLDVAPDRLYRDASGATAQAGSDES